MQLLNHLRRVVGWVLSITLAGAIVLTSSPALGAPPGYDHIVIVMEENRTEAQIIGDLSNAPYLNSLAANGVILGTMFAIQHPSQPNYLHLFSGANQGVMNDGLPPNFSTTPTSTYPFKTANLAAQLIAEGFSFAGFSEELESAGAGDRADYDPHSATQPTIHYRRKHNPWANWVAKVAPIPANQLDSAVNRAFTQFPADFSRLPTVSFVIPNQLHDMHDGSRREGDDWLAANLNAYAVWARTNNSLLIVTWDEDDYNRDNQIPTILYGANLREGAVAQGIWTLHNLLRTVEEMYGLATHAGSAGQVRSIVGPFVTDPPVVVATFRQELNDYNGAQDTQLRQETPNTAYATSQDINADLDTSSAPGNQEGQGLVRFDGIFGSIAGQIPADAIILSAKLLLFTPLNSGGSSYNSTDTFGSHRMISDWSDTATWNSFGGGVSTDNNEAAMAATFAAAPVVDGAPAIFDVTSDIELFQSGAPNRGWVIRPSSGSAGDGWTFQSSEFSGDPAFRPTLEVLYSVSTESAQVTLIAANSSWRYWDRGTDQGTGWRAGSFDDSTWSNGIARLGYGGDGETTTLRRMGASGNTTITFYFRRAFYIPDPAKVLSLQARLTRDDGAVIYLNDGEVWRDSMPDGTPDYLTLASATIGGSDETSWLIRPLSPAALVPGWNTLAAEVHQAAVSSSDVGFDFELTGVALFPTLPSLSISRADDLLTLQWPGEGSYFALQSAANLVSPVVWFEVPDAPVLSDGQWTVVLPVPSTDRRFFRLQTR